MGIDEALPLRRFSRRAVRRAVPAVDFGKLTIESASYRFDVFLYNFRTRRGRVGR